jgi:hypothetical protein
MNKRFRKFFLQMIHYKLMRYIFVILLSLPLLSVNLNAEYEMHIPNCTQKGVENCGGFLFVNETGDVLFCGSESCIDLKLPKSWKAKQKDKQSKQDQIIEMLSNIQVGSVNTGQNVVVTAPEASEKKSDYIIAPKIMENFYERSKNPQILPPVSHPARHGTDWLRRLQRQPVVLPRRHPACRGHHELLPPVQDHRAVQHPLVIRLPGSAPDNQEKRKQNATYLTWHPLLFLKSLSNIKVN